jgi:hypothetical protein
MRRGHLALAIDRLQQGVAKPHRQKNGQDGVHLPAICDQQKLGLRRHPDLLGQKLPLVPVRTVHENTELADPVGQHAQRLLVIRTGRHQGARIGQQQRKQNPQTRIGNAGYDIGNHTKTRSVNKA